VGGGRAQGWRPGRAVPVRAGIGPMGREAGGSGGVGDQMACPPRRVLDRLARGLQPNRFPRRYKLNPQPMTATREGIRKRGGINKKDENAHLVTTASDPFSNWVGTD